MKSAGHDVFISYSSKDKTTADAICALLERDGLRCWIAPRDIAAGANWAQSIIGGINNAKVFVLVFSGFSNASSQIKREVERAAHRELPIIPFRIEDKPANETLEFFISSPHWMDAFEAPLEAHVHRLAGAIQRLIAEDGGPAPTIEHRPPPEPPPIPRPAPEPVAAAAAPPPAPPPARKTAGRLVVGGLIGFAVAVAIGAALNSGSHTASSTASSEAAASSEPASDAAASAAAAAVAAADSSAQVAQAATSAPAQPVAPLEVNTQDGAGDNIVDAGHFDTSLIGHVVYYEKSLTQYIPVKVENINVANTTIEWNDDRGNDGWTTAADFYTEASVRARGVNTAGAVLGAAIVAGLACAATNCTNQSSQASSDQSSNDQSTEQYQPNTETQAAQ